MHTGGFQRFGSLLRRIMRLDRSLRIVSNTRWFEGRTFAGRTIESLDFPRGGLRSILQTFLLARKCDAAVINVDGHRLFLLCLLKRLLGLGRCRLISVDIHLSPPRTFRELLKARLMGGLLREVDLFIHYFRATERMEEVYRLDPGRSVYVPFKINDYARVHATEPRNEGFALVCGRSDRDYHTLAAAVEGLEVPIVILEYSGADRAQHGQSATSVNLPANVTVATDDGSSASWIEWISRANFIILPIVPDVLKPSGIGTYLTAMGLGKCVVITESPATQGLIDTGQAVLVPPGDAVALREAIVRVAEDALLRDRVGAAGKAYALAVGDESRLAADIVAKVGALLA